MSEMTGRERFLTALWCREPDRVPLFDFLFSRNVYRHFIGHAPTAYAAETIVECSLKLGLDGASIPFGGFAGLETPVTAENNYIDEWGTTYKIDRAASWPIDAPIAFPIHDRKDWENYSVPNVNARGRADEIGTAKRLCPRGELAVMGTVLGPYSAGWSLLGMENFSLLTYDDPDLVKTVLRTLTDWLIEAGRLMVGAGADLLGIGEDLGSVSGPLMSPEHFREFILPEFRRMVQAFRGYGVPVFMHNDGNIRIFMDDLVATGINGYHPVERAAGMNLAEVKTRYGKVLCPVGNVNNKTTMVFGTPKDVEAEVRECIRIAGPGGGYILASDHSLHDDMPIENVLALYETAKRFGKYPLSLD
jgi:uroporphyrinogen decarboxylase